MSIIAIKGIPFKMGLWQATMFSKVIGGPHEILNFAPKGITKTLYIRISERLDPVQIVDKINSRFMGRGFNAFVPESVPDLPVVSDKKTMAFEKKFNKNSKNKPKKEKPHVVAVTAHYQLFNEMQFKYPGLFNLSRKTGHKLLNEIASILSERVKKIMDSQTDQTAFELTRNYRKAHPHSGDFDLIVTTLHRLQDASGAPHMPLTEGDLTTATTQPYVIENIPVEKIRLVCTNYSFKVAAAMTSHIEALDSKVAVGDDEDMIARKKVREEMKKMLPYMPLAIKQIVSTHFVPEEQPHRRIRIYGEPYLPNRDAMTPFTRQYVPFGTKVIRARNMYNLIIMKVEQNKYAALRAMDSTVVNGAKIMIRDSDIPLRSVPESVRAELASHFGGTPPPAVGDNDDIDVSGDEE